MSSRPSSNTAKRPQGPAPMISTSVLMGSDMRGSCGPENDEIVSDDLASGDRPAKSASGQKMQAWLVRQHESAVKSPVGERYPACGQPHSNSRFAACGLSEGSYAGWKGHDPKKARSRLLQPI